MAPPAPRPAARPPALAVVVGPTASGKTDLALALTRQRPVEILVADSRQVYRGMDIGTAKPDAAARAAVPHHLIDLVDPDQEFSVADWVARARGLLPEIAARGRLPLVVGGTGLYLEALLRGFDFGGQPSSPPLRRRLAAELESEGLEPLAERLRRLDPPAAARTDLRNPYRVLRALERAEAAGAPVTPRGEPFAGRLALLGVRRPRETLARRIEERAAAMYAGGLLDEVAGLLAAGYAPDLAPLTGHGTARWRAASR